MPQTAQYKVRWDDGDETWELAANLDSLRTTLLRDFDREHPAEYQPARRLVTNFGGMREDARTKLLVPRELSKSAAASLSLEAQAQLFDVEGICLLSNTLGHSQIERCRQLVMQRYEQCMHTIRARDMYDTFVNKGFDTFKLRLRGRYDMVLHEFIEETPFRFLQSAAPWLPLIQRLLGADAKLVHTGVMLSMPGAVQQNWHQDGPHLNKDWPRRVLPPHLINVFVPLVDMPLEVGPTEFIPRSHRAEVPDATRVVVTAQAGGVLLFDYRLIHRGLQNDSTIARPVIYLTYARAGYVDKFNFSRGRYQKFPEQVPFESRADRYKAREESKEKEEEDE